MFAFVTKLKTAAMAFACLVGVASTGAFAQGTTAQFPEINLPYDSVTGPWAIDALGTNLPAVAAWYGMTPQELKREFYRYWDRDEFFQTEWTLWRTGRLWIREHFHYPEKYTLNNFLLKQLAPLESTLSLSSNPLAPTSIVLTFSPRNWQPNNIASYSDTEKIAIQHIWARVSQTYAPFNVNVTTDWVRYGGNPGYGLPEPKSIRVFVYPFNVNPNTNIDLIGGDANFASFSERTPEFTPRSRVDVRVNLIERNPAAVAHTIAHLIGHSLGLRDETIKQPQFPGYPIPPYTPETEEIWFKFLPFAGYQTLVGRWSPVMGYPGDSDVTQFSRGDFQDATTRQDSFAIMERNGLSLRLDDAGDLMSAARLRTTTTGSGSSGSAVTGSFNGVIERLADFDTVYFQAGAGPLTASLSASNVDVALALRDAKGTFLAWNKDPHSLGASLTYNIRRPGTYYLQAWGVGIRYPLTLGISPYGNRGPYTVTARYMPTALAEPTATFTASQSGRPDVLQGGAVAGVPITFNGQVSGGGVANYAWDFGEGGRPDARSTAIVEKTFANPGTYTVSLRVTGSNGLTGISRKQLVVAPGAPRTP